MIRPGPIYSVGSIPIRSFTASRNRELGSTNIGDLGTKSLAANKPRSQVPRNI